MGNEKGDSNVTDGGSIQVLPWGINQILVTACCSSATCYFLLEGATSHHAKPPLLLHSRVRHFSFNCPQEVRGKSHWFTLKLVNTNNYFCNLAEWSVRPDITQTVVKTLSLTSAVYFCSCRSLQNSYLDIPNRKSLSSSWSWQQSPV